MPCVSSAANRPTGLGNAALCWLQAVLPSRELGTCPRKKVVPVPGGWPQSRTPIPTVTTPGVSVPVLGSRFQRMAKVSGFPSLFRNVLINLLGRPGLPNEEQSLEALTAKDQGPPLPSPPSDGTPCLQGKQALLARTGACFLGALAGGGTSCPAGSSWGRGGRSTCRGSSPVASPALPLWPVPGWQLLPGCQLWGEAPLL